MTHKNRIFYRKVRHARIRKRLSGTSEVPRMAVAISNKHIVVQFIDDVEGKTLGSASTIGKKYKLNKEVAKEVGKEVAAVANEKGFKRVVVDRSGLRYHGRLQALVETAVEAGLVIKKSEEK